MRPVVGAQDFRGRCRTGCIVGDRLSVADRKVFVWILHLKSGKLDQVPVDIADPAAPKLVENCERIRNHPGVIAYYAKHGLTG